MTVKNQRGEKINSIISIAEIHHSQRKVSDIDMTVKQQQVTIAA